MMSGPTPEGCVLYTTDLTYMFPSLVSAIQARRHVSKEKADVAIFCLKLDHGTEDVFSEICEREGLRLFFIDPEVIEGQTAMLARLFLDRFVPANYKQCLYLDSDVQISGSLDPLMDVELSDGQFMAANDPFTFLLQDKGSLSASIQKHLYSLGMNEEQSLNYFNSGVLRISREGWNEIGMEAWEGFQERQAVSRFPDQDVLNLAGAGRRLLMSMQWNFPTFMRNARLRDIVRPTVEHFMSNPKPWHGSFPPWTDAAHLPYQEAVMKYPSLLRYAKTMKRGRRAAYQVKQRGKALLETVSWGFSVRRSRVLAYEKRCVPTSSQAGGT
jgi:lipopolysaccharide biosynthesis glycosyltransferase